MANERDWRLTAAAMTVLACAGHSSAQCTPQWIPMPESGWLNNDVWDMVEWRPTLESPSLLVASGNFVANGAHPLRFVGAWNGSQWTPLGDGLPGVGLSLLIRPSPRSGLSLLISGSTAATSGGQNAPTPAMWTGIDWSPIGGGVGSHPFPEVRTMGYWNQNLFIGGFFESAGGVYVNRSARWDGTQWHATDLRWVNGGYYAMHIHNGDLFVGGTFGLDGLPPSQGVLKWSGSQLDAVAGAPSFDVFSLGSYQGKLIAGGFFFTEPGQSQPGEWIAQWDGNSWGPLGSGMNSSVRALTTFDPDGPGPMPELLIAGGWFSMAGGVPASRIAAWDGSQWMPMGTGVNGSVQSLCVYQNQLYVGGLFTLAGGQPSPYLARWGCPQPPCYANCDGSTRTPALTANDFMCFLNKYASADPAANCDNSTMQPMLNANDFACFINKYAAGCP